MDEDGEYELLESSQRVAFEIITRAILAHLIAEVATINRSPGEARKFVADLKGKLEDLNGAINKEDSIVDKAWYKTMDKHIDLIFKGINFRGETK